MPFSGDEESGDFQIWTKASRQFFAKDKAYREWQSEDDHQDGEWEAFKIGPWKAIQKKRRNERAKTRVLGVHRSSWDQLHRLLKKDRNFRRWQPRAGEDNSWEVFTAKGGPWHREIRQDRLLCETAAIESTRAQPSARGKHQLLDRMPSASDVRSTYVSASHLRNVHSPSKHAYDSRQHQQRYEGGATARLRVDGCAHEC